MKALIIVDQDPEIKAIDKEINEGRKMFEEAQEFMRKNLDETHKKLVGSKWDLVEDAVRKRGLLPEDYNKEEYAFAVAEGVLYLYKKSEMKQRMPSFFRTLMGD